MKGADKVADAFMAGRPASASNLYTTGKAVVSYETTIAFTTEAGGKVVKANAWDYSNTTSRHANALIRAGAKKETT